jgi:glutaredoxin-related protein
MKLNHIELPRVNIQATTQQYIYSLNLISDSLGIPCLLLDSHNRIIYVNNVFCAANSVSRDEILNHKITEISMPRFAIYTKFAKQVKQQHAEIITTNQKRIYLEVAKQADSSTATIVYKTPIFDLNNNLVGLHLQYKPFTIARLANLATKFYGFSGYPLNKDELQNYKLSQIQQLVIYLYARNYSYTEVSSWISRFGFTISPSGVNKQLDKLKKLLNVADNQALKDMSLKLGYDFAIPADLLPEGSHDITEDVFDLWIC